MTMNRLSVVVVGIWLGCQASGWGQEAPRGNPGEPLRLPTTAPPTNLAPNPALAQAIVRTLQESGRLSQYRIQVLAYGSNVDLIGDVADENQHETVLRLLRTVPGIGIVRDWIQVRPQNAVIAVQAPLAQPLPLQPAPLPLNGGKGPERIDGPAPLPEPTPIFQAPSGPNPTMQPPPMPPYAWPTFAPYNNMSRVAYPNAYPYEQWPFIGPIYPFPRVPLGWRSVSLTWEDGHWWYHRNPTGHDWWRIRYH